MATGTSHRALYGMIMVLGLIVAVAGLALMIAGGALPKLVLVIVGAFVMLGGLLMSVSGYLGRRTGRSTS